MNRWLILFCAFLVFVSACKDDASKIDKLAAECSSGDKDACKDLADIAKNDKDEWVRKAAVEKLTDQAVLAKIALEDFDVGYTAIKNLADQSALAKVAADNKDWRVRLILKYITAFDSVPTEHRERLIKEVLPAIRVLSYPAVVSTVGEIVSIKTEWNHTSRSYIGSSSGGKPGEIFTCSIKVQKLPEPLSHTWTTNFPSAVVALNFREAPVNAADLLEKPFEKITDQALLADIARNDKEWKVRRVTVEKLTDQTLLADIARNDQEGYVREATVKKLNYKALLANIAKNDWDLNVRKVAVEKLTDQKLLADIARND